MAEKVADLQGIVLQLLSLLVQLLLQLLGLCFLFPWETEGKIS
jgi:hypothetical protein